MRDGILRFCGWMGLLAVAAAGAPAGGQDFTAIRVQAGLVRPIYATAPVGDFTRLFIVSQRDISSQTQATAGRIKVLDLTTNTLKPDDFLVVSNLSANSEQGLLGLAFHPQYEENGYFYVCYTEWPSPGVSVIARYQRSENNPDMADPGSAHTILRLAQPFSNHNGGWIGFGPDGYLYAAFGDGGSQNDPGNRAQDITSQLLGKMLRIDVDGPNDIVGDEDDDELPGNADRNYAIPPDNPYVGITGDDEIWAFGLRNPWRPAFDRGTGDLWIADVGQDAIEELNFQSAGEMTPLNYGWRCMEGLDCTGRTGCTCNAPTLTLPIHTYAHGGGRCSITGGYVYRGCAIPALRGTYFFADYCSANVWSLRYSPQEGVTELTDRTAQLAPVGSTIGAIASFGEDARGELYICDQGGELFKIVPANAPDCNSNGSPDYADISSGFSADCNCDGIPDECVSPGPTILSQPQGGSTCTTDALTLSVSVGATGGATYVWQKDGSVIPGVGGAMLVIPAPTADDAGDYQVFITDACGTTASSVASVTIRVPGDANCDGRLDNFDIDPFVLALVDGVAAWEAIYACDATCVLDIDEDGDLTNFDIDPFVALLVQ
ncbi:MAG: PQQ-dependent sugar dehydrogenase [Phycisphaerales bacterium]|nr:PQQ-dependent sugar dehydrogenase [Phycisphaerales bacterium]